ncbi:hypothetical protein J8I32_31025 [Cupriavidus sp. AcVe19-1a]|nr:hypothetical protein [Cupriavidus sp. AcVe19-1a]
MLNPSTAGHQVNEPTITRCLQRGSTEPSAWAGAARMPAGEDTAIPLSTPLTGYSGARHEQRQHRILGQPWHPRAAQHVCP